MRRTSSLMSLLVLASLMTAPATKAQSHDRDPGAVRRSLVQANRARAGQSADAVVALVDSGINPYHSEFRDRSKRALRHPSTYISGFPRDAEAIRLTLDAANYEEAVTADCRRWAEVKSGRLYWFPGTRIVGAISFDALDPMDCENPLAPFSGPILDDNGHGTMVASRAAAAEYGACPSCLIVSVQGTTPGVKWAGKNSNWIDVQSNSWGPIVPVWTPVEADIFTSNPDFIRTVESAARKHLAFWASGNGVATRGGALGHPTFVDPRMSAPSIVMVGGHDSGYVNTWPDFPPHVVSDSCNCWAAYHNQLDESSETVGSGTSSATPFAAGGAGAILKEARAILGDRSTGVDGKVVASGARGLVRGPLADGRFTVEEWRRVLYSTATERPEAQHEDGPPCDLVDGTVLYSSTPVAWRDVPEDYPEYLHIGYGAVDRPALRTASAILEGRRSVPDRSDVDAFFDQVDALREAQYELYTTP